MMFKKAVKIGFLTVKSILAMDRKELDGCGWQFMACGTGEVGRLNDRWI
ncbi:hypothetical protein [Paenibacillus dendrobii]|nr:hypothetical protein [Paenibacillus dendrobii]